MPQPIDASLDVFFYGLNMDEGLLATRGVQVHAPRRAHIEDHAVHLASKALLLRAPGAQAHGMLFQLHPDDLARLYQHLPDYRAHPFIAITDTGQPCAALSMVHRDPPIDSAPDPDYAVQWHALVARLGLASARSPAPAPGTSPVAPPALSPTPMPTPSPARRQSLQGSCHCGAVRFRIDSDFPELTTCDCTICRRKNALMVKVHESQFTLLSGEQALSEYQFHTRVARHFFCRHCGIYPFHRKRVTPDHFGINVHCLEGFDPTGIQVRATVGAAMP